MKFVDSKSDLYYASLHDYVVLSCPCSRVVVVLFCLFVFVVFFSPFSTVIASLGKREQVLCFSSICMFILHVHALIFVLFIFLLVSGVGCGL